METIGERIRKRREELNMSQAELARILGYKSRTSVYKIELGERGLPQKKIKQIAEALHTTPEYIMGWEEKPKEKETTKMTFSNESYERLHRAIQLFAEKITLDDSKIYEAILKAMAELDEKDQGKVLNYAETLKESKSYREYVEVLQKHPKKR